MDACMDGWMDGWMDVAPWHPLDVAALALRYGDVDEDVRKLALILTELERPLGARRLYKQAVWRPFPPVTRPGRVAMVPPGLSRGGFLFVLGQPGC